MNSALFALLLLCGLTPDERRLILPVGASAQEAISCMEKGDVLKLNSVVFLFYSSLTLFASCRRFEYFKSELDVDLLGFVETGGMCVIVELY